jgi:hypothetical protein
MTQEKNQQPQVSLKKSSEQPLLGKPAETAAEFSRNVNSETLFQAVENNAEQRLKALSRLMMVSLTWSMAGLSKRQ